MSIVVWCTLLLLLFPFEDAFASTVPLLAASGRELVDGGLLVTIGKYSGLSKSYAGVAPVRLKRAGGRKVDGAEPLDAAFALFAPKGSLSVALVLLSWCESSAGSASPASKNTSVERLFEELTLLHPGNPGSVSAGPLNAAKSSSDRREVD